MVCLIAYNFFIFPEEGEDIYIPYENTDSWRFSTDISFENSQDIWFYNSSVFAHWNGEAWKNFPLNDSLRFGQLTRTKHLSPVVLRDNRIYHFNDKGKWAEVQRSSNIPDFFIYKTQYVSTKEGILWIIARDGKHLIRFDGSSWQLFPLKLDNLNLEEQFLDGGITEDVAGNIWIGGSQGGIYAFNPTQRNGNAFKHQLIFLLLIYVLLIMIIIKIEHLSVFQMQIGFIIIM